MLKNTTHYCMKDVLTFAQIIGLFPVDNVRSSNPSKISFNKFSWKIFYNSFLASCYFICGLIALYKALNYGSFINQLISPLFYLNLCVINLLFIKIAPKWGPFVVEITKTESIILKKYPVERNLRKVVNFYATLFYIAAITERVLSTLNFVYSTTCQNNALGLEYYLRKRFHFIFHYFDYDIMLAVCLLFISHIGTFAWNFGDIFIIFISAILSTKLKRIKNYVKSYLETLNNRPEEKSKFIRVYNYDKYNDSNLKFWRAIREDYEKVAGLCKLLNEILSDLIIYSYVNNLTFILIQLFNSFRKMESLIQTIYFIFSFGFVICRTIAVSVYGASVYDNCKEFIPVLNSVPSGMYNVEVHRLIMIIHIDSAALTGHNFFKLTKGLVLNVAAAVITYELMLIQFNQATLNKIIKENITICY